MPASVTVLYVGSGSQALDLASALTEAGVTNANVVAARPERLTDTLDDDRLDCLVLAAESTNGTLSTVRDRRPDLPVVGFGSGVDEQLQVALGDDASVEQLATCLGSVLSGNDDTRAETRLTELARGADIYVAVDADWRITHWDPRLEEWTGTPPASALGDQLWAHLPATWTPTVRAEFEAVMETRDPATVEAFDETADRWVEVRVTPTTDGGLECFLREITERKRQQEELSATRTRLERTLERVDDAFFAVDDDWTLTYLNQQAEHVMGVDADAVGTDLWELFPEAVETRFYEEYRTAVETQEATTFVEYYDPLETWFEVRAYPSESGLSVYFKDVTERRERQQELRRLTRAVEEAPIGFAMSDPSRADNPLVYVNEAFEQLTGYDKSEIQGRNCRFLQGPETNPETVTEMRAAIDAEQPVSVEVLNYRVDGTPFWNQVDIAPVHSENGELLSFVGFQRDVTADNQLETRLRALHETTQELMGGTSDEEISQLVVDAASEILDLPLTTLWRYDEADEAFVAVARTAAADEAFDRSTLPVDPTDDETLSATKTPGWTAFQTGEVQVFDDLQAEVEDGHVLPVRSSIVAPLGEYGILATAGMEPYEFDDRDADLFRILATSTETALARDERERELERQNERLDEFVSVVSHDLRNPLQVAMTRLETYLETGEEEHLDIVAANHDRMNDLIDGLLTLARQGETVSDPDHVTLSAVANQAWTTVDTAGATIEMPTAATLLADEQRLQQLFENLFRNAVEHGGDDVTITVDTLADDADATGFFVADDGPGIPDDEREGIFEHGYSTADRGSGLGLSIVKRIADAHGWDVRVTESNSGGAQFEVVGVGSLTSTG